MSFYAFRDDNLYQTGQQNDEGVPDSNEISSDAPIIVETLLSATVHDVDDDALKNLEENVTISFQLLKVGFHKLILIINDTNKFISTLHAYNNVCTVMQGSIQ